METFDVSEFEHGLEAAIERVLETGVPVAITADGAPTGVLIASDAPRPQPGYQG